jgi:hypothetical protein
LLLFVQLFISIKQKQRRSGRIRRRRTTTTTTTTTTRVKQHIKALKTFKKQIIWEAVTAMKVKLQDKYNFDMNES